MATNSKKPDSIEALLDTGADALDSTTLGKLRQARHQALAPRRGNKSTWWMPVGAVTAASAAAVMSLWVGVIAPQARVNTLEDLEMLAAADHTDLYEKLDFYDWLESQQQRTKIDAG